VINVLLVPFLGGYQWQGNFVRSRVEPKPYTFALISRRSRPEIQKIRKVSSLLNLVEQFLKKIISSIRPEKAENLT
jgi:hypothetical protein